MRAAPLHPDRIRHHEPRRVAGQASDQAPALRAIHEVLLVATGVIVYFVVRGLVAGREATAFANADRLIALEERLGIFWEPTIHGWVHTWPPLTTLANWVYIWWHWPVLITTLLWLLIAHRDVFPVYRTAMLVSGFLGFLIFATYPVAPPRFMAELGFVDTVALHSNSYRVLQPPALTNLYAALPSLHFGWNLLMGIALVRHATSRPAKVFGVVMPLAMFWAIVATANHYILDGVAGGSLVLVGLGVAWWQRRGGDRSALADARLCEMIQGSSVPLARVCWGPQCPCGDLALEGAKQRPPRRACFGAVKGGDPSTSNEATLSATGSPAKGSAPETTAAEPWAKTTEWSASCQSRCCQAPPRRAPGLMVTAARSTG